MTIVERVKLVLENLRLILISLKLIKIWKSETISDYYTKYENSLEESGIHLHKTREIIFTDHRLFLNQLI